MKNKKGVLGLLFVAVIWGSGFVASDLALRSMAPMMILCVRFFIAALVMTAVAWKRIRNISKAGLRCGIILGFLLFFAFSFQTIGLKYTTPSKNAFLTATNVIIVPFIALFIRKKKVDRYSLTGSFLALVGIGLLSLSDQLFLGYGDGLSLVCAICFALHIYFTGEFVEKHDAAALTALQMLVAFLLSAVGAGLSGSFSFAASRESIVSVIYLGLFSTTLAFFLQTYSQRFTNETTASLILSMESVFGTLFSLLIIKEHLTPRMIIGCLLILSAVILSETKLKFLRTKLTA